MKIDEIFKSKYHTLRHELKRPYIIAEIGVNHEGSIDKAKEMITLAKEGGADAAKFQSYKANKLASKNSPSYWDLKKEPTRSQYELFKKYDMFGEKEYTQLAQYCKKVGIDFISTPFDDEAIEFLYPWVPFYKIASSDITNIPFLRKVAQKGKPILLSTGASTLPEIELAINEIQANGSQDIALLHCILNYPTSNNNANLRMIIGLQKVFPDFIIGYSDHTIPDESMLCLTTAYILGAQIIEKHFTFDKSLPGNDHYHAMDVVDLKNFVDNISKLIQLLGNISKKPIPEEYISRQNARRSIVVKGNIKKGEKFTEKNLTYKRPASGISPLFWGNIIGKSSRIDLEDDHILTWDDIEL
jgi:N-acetylneuraminate synthase